MTDFDSYPRQDIFTTTTTASLTAIATTISLTAAVDFTLSSGTCYGVIDPTGTPEVVEITAVAGANLTVTRGIALYEGGPSTAATHASGVTFIISDNWKTFDDIATASASKMDKAGGTFTGAVDFSGASTTLRLNNLTTAEINALTPLNGMRVYDTDLAVHKKYEGGAWVTEAAGATANATESAAGKVELATLAEQGAQTASGSDGPLAIQAQNTIKEHVTYTPAYLTGGNGATSVIGTWIGVADGTFQMDIDGVTRSMTVDFTPLTGANDMDDVADYIQTAIRAQTSSTETCVWSVDHFIISSVDTTVTSAITVTSATGAGTDISGAGGTAFMDSDVGNGVVTAAVLNKAGNENRVPVLNSSGEFDDNMIEQNFALNSTLTAKGSIYGATAASTPGELAVGTDTYKLVADSGEATGLDWVPAYRLKVGVVTKDLSDASVATAITGVGFQPDYIEFSFHSGAGGGTAGRGCSGQGVYDGSASSCVYTKYYDDGGSGHNRVSGTDANDCIKLYNTTASDTAGTAVQDADVSAVGADGFTLNWTKVNSPTGTGYVQYKAFKFTA